MQVMELLVLISIFYEKYLENQVDNIGISNN